MEHEWRYLGEHKNVLTNNVDTIKKTSANTAFGVALETKGTSLLLGDGALITHIDTVQELSDILLLDMAFLFKIKDKFY